MFVDLFSNQVNSAGIVQLIERPMDLSVFKYIQKFGVFKVIWDTRAIWKQHWNVCKIRQMLMFFFKYLFVVITCTFLRRMV